MSFVSHISSQTGIEFRINLIREKRWLVSRIHEASSATILRTPGATSAARGFNKIAVEKFFDLLESLMEEHHFEPHNIHNVDETGMSTVRSKPSKIIAKKGRLQVGTITSAERGTLVTVEICMSVTGSFIPPLFIFPRVRMKPELMDGAPMGSTFECHKSGWMQLPICTKWF